MVSSLHQPTHRDDISPDDVTGVRVTYQLIQPLQREQESHRLRVLTRLSALNGNLNSLLIFSVSELEKMLSGSLT